MASWSKERARVWRSLSSAAGRREEGAFLVEGVRALEEALRGGAMPEELVVASDTAPDERLDAILARVVESRVRVFRLPARQVARLADTVTNQGLLARFALPPPSPWPGAPSAVPMRTIVVLDGVQDPGNVGLMIRHAAAFGADAVAVLPETADPFGPKAVRASAGAIFSVEVRVFSGASELLDSVRAVESVALWRLEAGEGTSLWELDQPRSLILVVGSEAHGVSSGFREALPVRVPQTRRVDSCNAAFTASMALAWRYATVQREA